MVSISLSSGNGGFSPRVSPSACFEGSLGVGGGLRVLCCGHSNTEWLIYISFDMMFYPRDDIVVKMQWSLVLTTCQPSLVCNTSGNRRPTYLPVSGLPPPGETARKPAMTVISLAKQDLGPKVSQSKREQHLPHQYSLLTHTNNASPEQAKKRQPSKTTNTLSSKHTNEISIHIYKHASPGVCIFPAPAVQSASCNLATPKTHPSCPSTQRKKNGPRHRQARRRYYIPPARPHLVSAHAHTHTHANILQPPVGRARVCTGTQRPLLESLLGRTSAPSSYAPVRIIRQTRRIYPDRPTDRCPSRPREIFGVVTI